MKISSYLKRLTLFAIAFMASYTLFFKPVIALEEPSVDILTSVPDTVTFSGVDMGNITSTSLTVTTSHIPQNATVLSSTLSFITDSSSTGFVKIVDKNTAETIDTISFSNLGMKSTDSILKYLQSWITAPETNRGMLMQAYQLTSDDVVEIIDIKIDVKYVLPDDLAPTIMTMSTNRLGTSDIEISWTSDEPSKGYLSYGKTMNYSTKTDYTIDYNLENTIILTNLTPGMTYHYKLVIEDMSGNKTTSEDNTFRTEFNFVNTNGSTLSDTNNNISPPKSFSAEYANNEVRLQWEKSDDSSLLGYVLYKKINASTYRELATLDTNDVSFIDSDIGIDNRYTYIIRSFSSSAISTASEEQMIYSSDDGNILGIQDNYNNEFDRTIQKGLIIFGFVTTGIFIIYLGYKRAFNKALTKKPGLENVFRNPDYFTDSDY